MEILKGLPVANSINEQLIEDIKNIDGELPHLAIIRVGERPELSFNFTCLNNNSSAWQQSIWIIFNSCNT